MDCKRITGYGIDHLVEGATDDKHPKIKETLNVAGASVLEITVVDRDAKTYDAVLDGLFESRVYQDNPFPEGVDSEKIRPPQIMQYFLESQRGYIACATFSTSPDNNPQIGGNLYYDKE